MFNWKIYLSIDLNILNTLLYIIFSELFDVLNTIVKWYFHLKHTKHTKGPVIDIVDSSIMFLQMISLLLH